MDWDAGVMLALLAVPVVLFGMIFGTMSYAMHLNAERDEWLREHGAGTVADCRCICEEP